MGQLVAICEMPDGDGRPMGWGRVGRVGQVGTGVGMRRSHRVLGVLGCEGQQAGRKGRLGLGWLRDLKLAACRRCVLM